MTLMMQEQKPTLPAIKLHSAAYGGEDRRHFNNFRSENRKRVEWTPAECEALKKGVEAHGIGSWKKILTENKEVFQKDRRVIDLVHKYNQIRHASSFHKADKKRWVWLDKHGQPVVSAMGEVEMFEEKFPFLAATRVAKKMRLMGYKEAQIAVAEPDNLSNAHYYNAVFLQGKPVLKKIVKIPGTK